MKLGKNWMYLDILRVCVEEVRYIFQGNLNHFVEVAGNGGEKILCPRKNHLVNANTENE